MRFYLPRGAAPLKGARENDNRDNQRTVSFAGPYSARGAAPPRGQASVAAIYLANRRRDFAAAAIWQISNALRSAIQIGPLLDIDTRTLPRKFARRAAIVFYP